MGGLRQVVLVRVGRPRSGIVGAREGRLDLDVALGHRLDEQPAGQLHVIKRESGVAQPVAKHAREVVEHGDQRRPRPALRVLERGGDPAARPAAAGGAERGDQRHVQAPRQ
jgi:hypothetical protein